MKLKNHKKKGRLLILLFIFLLSGALLGPVFADTYSLTLKLKKGSLSLSGLSNIEQVLYQVPGNWSNNDIITNIVLPLYGGNEPTHEDIDALTLTKVGTTKYDGIGGNPAPIDFKFKWTGSDFVITTAGDAAFDTGLEVDVAGLKLGRKLVPVIVSAGAGYYAILSTYSIPDTAEDLGKKVGETWTWAGSQKVAGPPPAPAVTNNIQGIINADNVSVGEVYLLLEYTTGYDYNSISLEVENVGTVTAEGSPSSRLIGQIATGGDYLDLLAGTSYTLKTSATNLFGATPEDKKNNYTFTTSGLGKQSVSFTLNNRLNFFGLGVPPDDEGNWHVTIGADTSTVKSIKSLITALGGTANVSNFGYLDVNGNVVGVTLNAGGTDYEGQLDIVNTNLSETQGYQVYLTGIDEGGINVTISNVAP